MKEDAERFYSTSEAARFLRVHPNTIRNMLQDGRLHAIKTRGKTGQYRFRETDLRAYLEAGGSPTLWETAAPAAPVHDPEAVLTEAKKKADRLGEEALTFVISCGNPFRVFGSYLEEVPLETYSKQLAGKAAFWVQETLRQVQLRYDASYFAILHSGTKENFLNDLQIGVAAMPGNAGEWVLTSVLVYTAQKKKMILDGTLQQFYPEMEKGVLLLPFEERERMYTGMELLSIPEFDRAVRDRQGIYFRAFLQKTRQGVQGR